jgi:two-component system, NtrC family, nitrogen regulation sensor histidine kinase NtrY
VKRALGLKGRVAAALAAAFAALIGTFLLLLLPLERQQRHRLEERDHRLLATLKEKYQRDLIYDLLSENDESLAANLADLALQPGVLWVRLEAPGRLVDVTGDPALMRRVLGTGPLDDPQSVLLIRGGQGEVRDAAGRRPQRRQPVAPEALPPLDARQGEAFEELRWNGDTVHRYRAELRAAGDDFGRLEILHSMEEVRRSEALTRVVLYGLAGTAFVLVLLVLNLLLSRLVVAPVRRVMDAMSQASTGDLQVRLPVVSRDEVGTMADAFNRMVGDLATSKQEVDAYSRDLERRVAERTQALQDSEERLRGLKTHLETVIAHVATGVISLDEEGRVTTFNDRAAEILGLPAARVEGTTLAAVLEGTEAARLLDLIAGVRHKGGVQKSQITLRLPQGRRTLSVVASALPAAPGKPPGTVVVLDDLTQLLASQRLEAWKEAVERVIHEIKNPLTPVALAAQTLRSAYQQDRARFDALFPSASDMILQSVQSLKDLITEFTRFSRLPHVTPRSCPVNTLVEDALAPYHQAALDGITIQRDLATGLPDVEADPEQMRRVLLNVINNGLEAMEGRGGRLTVSTRGPDPDGSVVIAVEDEGSGIEDVDRVFEPYYTTKIKGTGLGLLISRQIVEEHGGTIQVRSQVGTGTRVEVRLPTARDLAAQA